MFDHVYWGNSLQEWLIALGVAAGTLVLLKIVQRILRYQLTALSRKTKTQIDDLLVEVIRQTRFFFLLVASAYAASYGLSLSDSVMNVVQKILILALLVQGGLWVSGAISYWLSHTIKQRKEDDAASATTLAGIGFVSKLVLWAVVLLLALDNMGVNVTGLVAGLGIGGIAVALAIQNILGDLFASLSIVVDKPFVIGDFILVDPHVGTVERVGLKSTRIRSLSGEQIIFSNTDLLNSRIRNFKRMFERRILFSIGVVYQTTYENISGISGLLREIIEAQPLARFDRAHFKEYGDSALIYEVVYFVKSPEYNTYMDTQQAINLEIYRRFTERGISIAYPTRTLFLQHESSVVPSPAEDGTNIRANSSSQTTKR